MDFGKIYSTLGKFFIVLSVIFVFISIGDLLFNGAKVYHYYIVPAALLLVVGSFCRVRGKS